MIKKEMIELLEGAVEEDIGKINLLLFYILMRIKNKLKFVLLNVV